MSVILTDVSWECEAPSVAVVFVIDSQLYEDMNDDSNKSQQDISASG